MGFKNVFLGILILTGVSSMVKGEGIPLDSNKTEGQITEANHIENLYLSHLKSFTNASMESPYNFSVDSIPVYSDTTYFERIEALNTVSPFDLKYNEEVRNYIIYFSSRKAGFIGRALEKEDIYFPIFEELLDKYNLPQELKYLAIVESALNPNAKSRAGAVGLWQFMPSTGRMYGLKYNSKIDMRRDVYAATEAACRHFVDLYQIYHDWNLVLAAYNAGPGNVNKAIYRADSLTDYWDIRAYLPKETRGYVPAFIAVNYLMNYPKEHNIKSSDYQNNISLYTDTVYVNTKVYLKQVAVELGIPYTTVKQLNPEYRKGYIPATSSKKYKITLPLESIGDFIKYRQELLSAVVSDKSAAGVTLE